MRRISDIQNIDVLMDVVSRQLLYTESPIRMFLFEKESCEKNTNWICLTKDKDEKLLSCLESYVVSEGNIKDATKEIEKQIVCFCRLNSIRDSRCNGYGKKVETAWIFIADEYKYSYEIMCKVLMCIIEDKLTDLLYLEEVAKRLVLKSLFDKCDDAEKQEKKVDKPQEEHIIHHYCDKLLDHDWLISKYVSLALEEKGLPKSEVFLQLSALRYESREGKTRLYFGDKKDFKVKLKFSKQMLKGNTLEFKSGNHRTIRKLMELAGDGCGLMIDTADVKKIYGVLSVESNKVPDCYVEIEGYLHWSLNIDKEKIFEYSNGTYSLSPDEEKVVIEKFKELKEYLIQEKWVNEKKAEKIVECLRQIKEKATHGVSVIFGDGFIRREAKRLSKYNKAYVVEGDDANKRIELKEALEISGLTSIDGAIIANFNCECIGIGAILDGESLLEGNAGRGARYNSVTNYVRVVAEHNVKLRKESKREHKCFAAIFSEDKTIDFACICKGSKEIKLI